MYVNDSHKDWDLILPYVGFAYNTTKQESTGFSPFYLLYGREAKLPLDMEDVRSEEELDQRPQESSDHATFLIKQLRKARNIVQERMDKVEKQQRNHIIVNIEM